MDAIVRFGSEVLVTVPECEAVDEQEVKSVTIAPQMNEQQGRRSVSMALSTQNNL